MNNARSGARDRALVDRGVRCFYRYYIKLQPLKVARIGNSRGVRIPAATPDRYQIGDSVIMEEREDGILLRPVRATGARLSWEETARVMALEAEDWSEWNETNADGLDQIQWDAPVHSPGARRAAEKAASNSAAKSTSKRGSKRASKQAKR